jgi:NAD(P)-dependent dehydrogenase (short-subunit alcohol dehydrogenase family)
VLAVELARRQIRVNMVVPGFVQTEMTATISERARDAIIARIPLQRMGTADEMADVCWWVAGSKYMTGSVALHRRRLDVQPVDAERRLQAWLEAATERSGITLGPVLAGGTPTLPA